jgi:hypothetical protein
MATHTLPLQLKISSQHLSGNNSIIPPYSPDLAPIDFHVSLHLKTFLGGRRFHGYNDFKETLDMWCVSQAASFYDARIQELVPRYDKCLNNGGNYVEK